MIRGPAPAKLNLALVVGEARGDGKHEVVTVLQRVDLGDRVAVEHAPALRVDGFSEDTLVRRALETLADRVGVAPTWRARIWKRIPVGSGLGGGSSDAATALRLANRMLAEPLRPPELHRIAARLGADVPFFLAQGPQLGSGDGSELEPVELPQDYWIVLVVPRGAHKAATGDVYAAFDRRGGGSGFEERRALLQASIAHVRRARDLAVLPPNDLASSPVAGELRRLGAFRADVTGAGPAVYGIFTRLGPALAARDALQAVGQTWLTVPAWYG